MEIEGLSTRDLLTLHGQVMRALRAQGILRSANNPLADYAEWLCERALRVSLVKKSTRGYDAIDAAGYKYEIKARRVTPENSSRQLSAIRGLEHSHFDFLVGVLFDTNFNVMRGALIPRPVVVRLARPAKHTNSMRFILRDSVWGEPGVEDVTSQLRASARARDGCGSLTNGM